MFKLFLYFTFVILAKGIVVIRVPPENSLQIPPGHQLKFVHVNLGTGGPHTFAPPPQFDNSIENNRIDENSNENSPGLDSLLKMIMQRSHENGQHLLQRYGPFLGSQDSEPSIRPHEVILKAPGFNTTRNGVLSAFRGLRGEPFSECLDGNSFEGRSHEDDSLEVGPPRSSSEEDFNDDLSDNDSLMDDITRAHDPDSCPAFHKKFQDHLRSSDMLSTFKPHFDSIFDKYPELDNDIENLPSLHDLHESTLLSSNNPNCSKKEGMLIKHLTRKIYAVGFSTTPIKRLAAGRYISNLLDEIQNHMEDEEENPDQKKMSLFGSTSPFLKAIMSAMGGENGFHNENPLDYPKPGSMFVVEVYQKIVEQTYHVRLHYKNGKGPLTDNHVMQLKECEVMCEFNKFNDLLKPLSLTKDQADQECADI